MMDLKRIVSLCLCTAIIILIAGCKEDPVAANRQAGNTASVESILEQSAAQTTEPATQEPEPVAQVPEPTAQTTEPATQEPEQVTTSAPEEGIDVDLTALSSTMVYSEVYNMVFYPENYIGKTVKMSGSYMVFHDDDTDKYYHACIISDATACCAQGIEFELEGEHSYPDDYPQLGTQVCVVGVFDIYWEGEEKYCTLRDARIV